MENVSETEVCARVQQTHCPTGGDWKSRTTSPNRITFLAKRRQKIPNDRQSALTPRGSLKRSVSVNTTTGGDPLGMCYYAAVIALTRSHTRSGPDRAPSPLQNNTVSFVCRLWSSRRLKLDVSARLFRGSCAYCDFTICGQTLSPHFQI